MVNEIKTPESLAFRRLVLDESNDWAQSIPSKIAPMNANEAKMASTSIRRVRSILKSPLWFAYPEAASRQATGKAEKSDESRSPLLNAYSSRLFLRNCL
jgi:hypothetical protein